jgi:hypothetical protein
MIWKRILNNSPSGVFSFTVSGTDTVQLPASSTSAYPLIIRVNWGDDTFDLINSTIPSTLTKLNHQYANVGDYTIQITGQCPVFAVENGQVAPFITAVNSWGDVFIRKLNFYGCVNLTTLPASSAGLYHLIDVNGLMRNTGITTIPSNLFTSSPNLTNVSDAFSFTGVVTIPNTLFHASGGITNYSSCFNGCSELTSIPVNLLEYATSGIVYTSMFRNCISLESIPVTLFDNTTNADVFDNIFNMYTLENALSGNAPAIWTAYSHKSGIRAFRNCEGLDNYNSIPTDWK